ncbi:MAG: replication-associated recombination protein A [Acidobacteriota bacterium]
MRSLFDDQPAPAASDEAGEAKPAPGTPLAERLRPRRLEQMVGQPDVVGPEGFLSRAIAADRLPSLILWGPPGCGKTTLAEIVARSSASRFVPFSAVTSGIKDVKRVMADASRVRRADGRRTVVFVDEIHRFNRAQQDALLPYVESGDIVLVGATTENPSFEVVGALLSRCRVVVLEALGEAELRLLLERALADSERGLGAFRARLDDPAFDALIHQAAGDARRALNLLELVVLDAQARGAERAIERADIEKIAQRKVLTYDKSGEEHFNLISALHKSLRESDVDASVYWLVRMLASGEQPEYVARRLLRFASEDVGLADPNALRRALEGWQAYERLGSPEGDLALVQVAIYLALAPKSNAAYSALKAARRAVADRPSDPVPKALRNAPTRLMKDLGYGAGYVYAHDAELGVGGLDCLPEALSGTRFYEPRGEGVEERFRARLEELRELRRRAREGDSR